VSQCPCGSGKELEACCGRYHAGEAAPTAEALMRSRYSAFVLKLSDYLRESWHPSSCPAELDISDDTTPWRCLVILATERGVEGDSEGVVEFAALYVGGQLHERSRFVCEEGRWFYLDGEILPPIKEERPGRNAPCPCGSGKKYKRCCGR
jgi:SEC-C motif-containing protein